MKPTKDKTYARTQLHNARDAVDAAIRLYEEGEIGKSRSEAAAGCGLLRQFDYFCVVEHGAKPR